MKIYRSSGDAGGGGAPAPAAPATAVSEAAAAPIAAAQAVVQGVQAEAAAKEQAAWTSLLPADLREHEALKGYAKPGDFVKEALTWKAKGEGALKLPGKDASEEERSAFFAALGVPGKAEEYVLQYPETYQKDEALDAWIRVTAHEAKLSNGQAAILSKALAGLVVGGKASTAQSRESVDATNKAAIETKYGAELPKMAELAKRGLGKSGIGATFYSKLQAAGLSGDPAFFDFAVGLGRIFEEDGFIRSGTMPEKEATIQDVFSYPSMQGR